MVWKGVARTRNFAPGAQAYYTPAHLAAKVGEIAARYKTGNSVFLDIGVGSGMLYKELPQPKVGVELANAPTGEGLDGVLYDTDVFRWSPPRRWRSKDVVVVMNPPFAKQIDVLNWCCTIACASLHIVWIAGLNVRHWDQEDKIDVRLQLLHEWLVPPSMSKFTTSSGMKTIRTVVQVWRLDRRLVRRRFSELSFPLDLAFKTCAADEANVFMTRVHSAAQVGSAGLLGRDVIVSNERVNVTPSGQARIRKNHPVVCGGITTNSLGTIDLRARQGGVGSAGSAMCLRAADADALVTLILQRRSQGVFYNLLRHRNSSSGMVSLSVRMLRRMLSTSWDLLLREIEYLDGVRYTDVQW